MGIDQTYHKLVRDRIPEMIDQSGRVAVTETLPEKAIQRELRLKLIEEIEEYMSANSVEDALEELADILEVIYALAISHHSVPEAVEKIRQQKREKCGGFEKGVYLLEVREK